MEYSQQSLHRVPVLNCEINDNDKNEDVTRNNGINVCHTNNVTNAMKNELPHVNGIHTITKKSKVKISKHKLRRKSAHRQDIKETLSLCTNYIRRVLHPISEASTSRKYIKQKSSQRKAKEIKVLYSPEVRTLRKKRSNINPDLIDDIYALNLDKCCTSFEDTSNIYVTHSKSRHNVKCRDVPKRGGKNSRKNCGLNKSTCINVCKSSPSISCEYDMPAYYKVVHFPNYDQTDTELEAINMARYYELNNFLTQTDIRKNLQKDEREGPSMPCFSNAQRGGGDDATVGIQCPGPNRSIIFEESKDKRKLNNDLCEHIKTLLDPLLLHENALYLAGTIFKYIIFGLALLIWAPCVISVYLCWFITYPLRPIYSSKTETRNTRCRKKSQFKIHVRGDTQHMTEHSIQTGQNHTWPFLMKRIISAYESIGITYKSLLNPGKNKSQCYPTKNHGRPSSKARVMTSGPNKKYTLYYSKNNGWSIKPFKLKSKKSNTEQCKLKAIRKQTSEPRRDKCIYNRNPDHIRPRNPQRISQMNPRKYKIDNNNKSCPLKCSRHGHTLLRKDTSGLPVHLKLRNPKFNDKIRPNARRYNKKYMSHCQRSSGSTMQFYKGRSQFNSKHTQCAQEKSCPKFKKICRVCNDALSNIKSMVADAETEIFGADTGYTPIYIHTLKKKPWFCVYQKCPTFYPIFLEIHKFYENLCHYFLLLIAACIWCPIAAFCYMCCTMFCKCLK